RHRVQLELSRQELDGQSAYALRSCERALELRGNAVFLLVRRPDPHPEVLEAVKVHAVAVVGNLDSVFAKANHHLRGVRVVAVFDQLRQRDVRLTYQALPEFLEKSGIDREVYGLHTVLRPLASVRQKRIIMINYGRYCVCASAGGADEKLANNSGAGFAD